MFVAFSNRNEKLKNILKRRKETASHYRFKIEEFFYKKRKSQRLS